MTALTEREFWLITVYFGHRRGFAGSHRIQDIVFDMGRLHCGDAKQIIDSLVDKKVLSLSPDKQMVKFTDYGIELYSAMDGSQKEWENQPIIRISNIDRDQILIRAGETFRANRVLREILGQIRSELCVIDAYLGPEIFDLIEDVNPKIKTRIITSDRVGKVVLSAYKAFANQYPSTDLRITAENKIHDRYILWDGSHGFHIGHSIKDLGKKDTQLNLLKNVRPQLWATIERGSKVTRMVPCK